MAGIFQSSFDNARTGRYFALRRLITNQDIPKERPAIAGVEVRRSASSSFGALSRVAFNFVRHQTRTVGALGWFIRSQMRRPKNRDEHSGWDHD
jgi:hypothetical protein